MQEDRDTQATSPWGHGAPHSKCQDLEERGQQGGCRAAHDGAAKGTCLSQPAPHPNCPGSHSPPVTPA